MTGTPPTSAPSSPGNFKSWTTRRWINAVVVTLVLQVVIIVLVGRRVVPSNARPTFATRVRLVVDQPQSLKDYLSVVDPALLALPSIHGFSGAAWLRYQPLVPTVIERTEVPEWLELNRAKLANEFVEFVSTSQVPAMLMVAAPLPTAGPYERTYQSETLAPLSRMYIEGGLARRTMLNPPQLPSWPHSEVLSNTIVRAVVDAAGWNFSATLVARSGSSAADDYALRLVENVRFVPWQPPGNQNEFSWGTFVFSWHTRPLPATNGPPIVP